MNSALIQLTILASEEGAENGAWLPHDIAEVFWGTLAFMIIAILLWKFAKNPGAGALKKRTIGIEETLDKARSARDAAEGERDEIKAALADSDTEAARIIEDSRQAADALTSEVAARAESDVELAKERADIDLAATRGQMEADLSGELSRLALGAAEKVVEGSLDDNSQQRLIDSYIGQVGTQN